MTSTQRFGGPLAEVLFRFCCIGLDAHLPAIHTIFASNEKHARDSANINICLCSQSLQVVFINTVNLPKVTPWMLGIFCQHDQLGNGMELGAGLNPFSVTCSGHHNTKDALMPAERQATVEAGAIVSLQDTLEFKMKDARFPELTFKRPTSYGLLPCSVASTLTRLMCCLPLSWPRRKSFAPSSRTWSVSL